MPAISYCPAARPCARPKPIRAVSKVSASSSKRAISKSRNEAAGVAEKLTGQIFVIIRQAGETGHLYGSVSPRDIAAAVTAGGFNANRNQIVLKAPIKSLGLHEVPVHLHPEIEAPITVNVARSAAEAERQAKGEAINAVEEATMDDLGLEVGAALAAAGGSLGDR